MARERINPNIRYYLPGDPYYYEVDNLPLKDLQANDDGAEDTNVRFDFLSNGFKCRTSADGVNDGTYIYMALAEAPFVNSKGVPCNAR